MPRGGVCLQIHPGLGLVALISGLATLAVPARSTAEPGPEVPMPAAAPATLDWSLEPAPDGASVRVRYTVTNTSDRTIYLCDALPMPGEKSLVLGRDFINVSGGTDGDVRFVRGRLASVAPVVIPLQPGARPLAPGKSLSGSATVRLPLAPAHYHGKAMPFVGEPSRAWLEIGWVEADATWQTLTMEDGLTLTTPSAQDTMYSLRAGPLPLP